MHFNKYHGLMMGAGFLLGTVGVKALKSDCARKCYVHGVAKGLQAKAEYQRIVEEAKAEVDDIVAEANYINLQAGEAKSADAATDAAGAEGDEKKAE